MRVFFAAQSGPSQSRSGNAGYPERTLFPQLNLSPVTTGPSMKESPIFIRTYDLLRWLLPATVKFPRQHRFVLAEILQRTAMRFQEDILEAGYGNRPATDLARADVTLAKLKVYLRLCHDLDLFSHGQYEHVSRMVTEIGRLLGGWRKSLQAKRTGPS